MAYTFYGRDLQLSFQKTQFKFKYFVSPYTRIDSIMCIWNQ